MRRRDVLAGIGGAAAWPLVARAQQRAMPVVGYLSNNTELQDRPFMPAFHQGLGEQSYVEGRNIEIVYERADFQYDRLPALASELVRRQVAVIVAATTSAAHAAKTVTDSIPIVFAVGADPVALGLVASLNRPGGNITGASFLTDELDAKRLELLHEIVPAVRSIGFFVNPRGPATEFQIMEAQNAAHTLGVRLVILNASTPVEIGAALADKAPQIGAVLFAGDPLFGVETGSQMAALASRYALPAIYSFRETVVAGGLMSYGPSLADAWHVAGNYAGRILKGAKPADLPVQRTTRIDMVLNLKTAKALGIEVPTATLLRATEEIQ
jgi:putative tryptophan/tyrosine transport system substrate-binding protein